MLTVGVALLGCEPAPGPPPAAQPWTGAAELASAAAKARQEGKDAKETEEYLDAKNDPWRPGESLLGEWRVTTPSTLAVAAEYASRIAEKPTRRSFEEQNRYMQLRSLTPAVTISRSRIEPVGAPPREYDVLRATSHEVEIQLRGGDGERVVLTFHGDSEIHAPGLVGLAGGVIWRRARRADIGLP